MTALDKILTELKLDSSLQTLYRMESHQSNQNMKIEKSGTIYCQDSNKYTYFSITERHHHYFAEKRLGNYLREYARRNANMRLDKRSFLNNENYEQVKNLVIQDSFNNDYSFSSIKMHIPPIFQALLQENAVTVENKYMHLERLPERSDPKTYKGGYGICGPWLELLLQLTFLYESHHLTDKDYLRYLEIRKYLTQLGYSNTKGGKMPFLEGAYYQLKINEDIFSPYHKYSIINSLEQIREEHLILPQSKLETDFRQETRKILACYEESREKMLRKLDEDYKKYL